MYVIILHLNLYKTVRICLCPWYFHSSRSSCFFLLC